MYLKGMESSDKAQAVMCLRGIGRDEKVSKVSTPSRLSLDAIRVRTLFFLYGMAPAQGAAPKGIHPFQDRVGIFWISSNATHF